MAQKNTDTTTGPDRPLTPEEQAAIDAYSTQLTGGTASQAADYLNNNMIPGNIPNNQGNVANLYAPMTGGPSVLTNTSTPSPTDTPTPNPPPDSGTGSGGTSGWFTSNAPTPDAFGLGIYSTLARPDWLQGPYVPPTWNETFTAPTAQDLLSDPGYLSQSDAIQRGLERSAAAKGTILSGGFAGKVLPRALGELASTSYGDLFNRAFNTYQQRYSQFNNAATLGAQARQLNETSYENDVMNNLNQYDARYRAYQDAVTNNLNYAQLGLGATTAGSPSLLPSPGSLA